MKQFLSYQCLNRQPLHQPCTAKTLQAGQAAHADWCLGLVGLKALPKRTSITIAERLCTCSSWAFFSTDKKQPQLQGCLPLVLGAQPMQ